MFIKIPANKNSMLRRKLVYGTGVNDADYIVTPVINGKIFHCPFYVKWNSMLKRCYSEKFQNKYPTYIGCSVCDEWLIFSNFRSWMKKQNWQGNDLDKDIAISENKIYSPDTCIFVSHAINVLLTDSAAARGNNPKGVHLNKQINKYQAKCKINGKQKHLGYFNTAELASEAYAEFKSKLILSVAANQHDPLRSYLVRIAGEINHATE